MKLNAVPFAMTASGEKTVECRLYDEKRQQITVGDLITFSLVNDTRQALTVRVVGLLRYATFADMFLHNNPHKFGVGDVHSLTESLLTYYSLEDQVKYGVLGIEIEKL
jgi:ASC-1-like (ASCH) protein